MIDGLLTHQLPKPLILPGVAIAIFVELAGLAFLEGGGDAEEEPGTEALRLAAAR